MQSAEAELIARRRNHLFSASLSIFRPAMTFNQQ
jgi:hypothetical protein